MRSASFFFKLISERSFSIQEKTAVPDHLMLIRASLLTKDGGYVYVNHGADGVADDGDVVDDGDYFGMDYVHDDVAERNR